jgi:ERCC4-type nuclease|tara:strand:- start:1453 stop:2190 length:738 start_codon:yes stop_codon:yes gene_type:complete
MELICDYREKHALKRFSQCTDKYKDIQIQTQNLALGDFQIGNMLFERKTHQDLASSILDGRYQEQSNRLMEHAVNNPSLKIIYIIEGNLDLYFDQHNVSEDKIMSCIMSLFYEKGFQVLLTKHLNETCNYLLKFCWKYYTKYEKECENNSVPICVQPKKKSSQIHKQNIGIHMLCNVPYISAQIATQLLEPFDYDLHAFLDKIKHDLSYLNEMKIKTRDNKERKLSKKIVETLKEYFFQENVDNI